MCDCRQRSAVFAACLVVVLLERRLQEFSISVSVIIPTCGRAMLLHRAIVSVLRQTLEELEIVVVVDGDDPESTAVLESIADPRVRWITLGGASGGSRARNAGVEAAKGKWIAFLDDDDEWIPEKLQLQLAAAQRSRSRFPVISTRILVRSEEGDLTWPRRLPAEGEPMSEYLFCRSGLFSGDGQLQTSAIFTSRELMLACPFNPDVRKHDDTEWYLKVSARPDVSIEVLPQALTIWHQIVTLKRVSLMGDWRSSLAWARANRALMTRKAYASFLLCAVASEAAGARDVSGFAKSLQEAFGLGRPRLLDLLLAFGFLLFPKGLRQRLRLLRERLRGSARTMSRSPKAKET